MYDFVVIDFETANNSMDSACSIGIVAVKDLEIVNEEYYLIKPPTEYFDKVNISIHGITYEDVKDSDTFDILWPNIKHYFEEIVIAHNAHFDISVLKNLSVTYNLDVDNFIYLDSISISNAVCSCGTSLPKRAAYLNVELTNHHNALDDSLACANVVIKTIEEYNSRSFHHFILSYNNLVPKNYIDIKATKSLSKKNNYTKFDTIKISDFVATTIDFDTNHPFYNKNVVITGEFSSFTRREIMQRIIDVGGIVKSSVSKLTNYLIVGSQDKSIVGEDGMSSKEEKAYSLISDGYNIVILNENEVINIINNN